MAEIDKQLPNEVRTEVELPAEEVVEVVQPDLQVLDGTESGQGSGFVDPVVGVTDQAQQDTFDYQTAFGKLLESSTLQF